tara:strand:- start:558 stop:1631 length:1074 start_codon:yes stop_codon:yes gene_type:complete
MKNKKLDFLEFKESYSKLLRDFNERIKNTNLNFPHPNNWFFKKKGIINNDYFIVVENNKFIRAVVAIKNQQYLINGKEINFKDIQLPISESIIDRKFLFQNLFFFSKIVNLSSNMHGLGMGGLNEPLPKILSKLNFKKHLIPFFIFPISIKKTLYIYLKRKKNNFPSHILEILSPIDFCYKFLINFSQNISNEIRREEFNLFAQKDDELWDKVKCNFDLISVKNKINLNLVYNSKRFDLLKIRIYENKEYLGWIVLKITKHKNSNHFFDSKTCTVVDMLCKKIHYNILVKEIKKISLKHNCDVILVNSTNVDFNINLKNNFFININSNFGFVFKSSENININKSWITRGDGDGPINL